MIWHILEWAGLVVLVFLAGVGVLLIIGGLTAGSVVGEGVGEFVASNLTSAVTEKYVGKPLRNWTLWFAWHPVWTRSGRRKWFVFVRRYSTDKGWEYEA